MLTLQNQELRVQILDPISDRQRLGSRYCTGGYIWQISDRILGIFFRTMFLILSPLSLMVRELRKFETALGQNTASINENVLVIGVGRGST